jgi:hypothetical protein
MVWPQNIGFFWNSLGYYYNRGLGLYDTDSHILAVNLLKVGLVGFDTFPRTYIQTVLETGDGLLSCTSQLTGTFPFALLFANLVCFLCSSSY